MRKLILPLLCTLCCVVFANAQTARLQARDAEWKNYKVPQTNFARQIDPDKDFIFRVPADWKQEPSQLIFNGPHSAKLTVTIQKIPDGYPLMDYFAAILQGIKDQPGVAEATVTRKTQLQDLEAREIFVEIPDAEGEMTRTTTWVTVTGPLAVAFNLKVPIAHAAEIEPFFKAVVQSVIFLSPEYSEFEPARSSAIKNPVPGPIHEIHGIVAALNEVNVERHSAITRLTALFSSHADVTVDLLLDRRPLVRAAAVEALAKTNNQALIQILWGMLDDREPLVAEAAARAVANAPDVVAKTLEHSLSGFITVTIARVWPFMTKDRRVELLQKIFNETAVPRPTSPPPAVEPPPPAVKPPPKKRGKVVVTDRTTTIRTELIADVTSSFSLTNDPNVQIGGLTLLSTMTPEEFKLPLARVMAANYDPLVAIALQVANRRAESLPLETIFKLVASSNEQVSKLAAQNLALSASVADIPRIEALSTKKPLSDKKDLEDELKLAVQRIRLREKLKTATTATQKREIIHQALSDSRLADFAWFYDCENTVSGCGPTPSDSFKRDFTVKPFAENLLPKKLKHFTAIPNPGQLVNKLHESLNSLQMDSPRAQAGVLGMMGFLRDELAQQLSAPPDAASLIEYTGIDHNAPISLAVWTADGALDSTSSAERKAIVLHVKDRGRFERAVDRSQRTGVSLTDLTEVVAIATRLVAAVPAILPLSAQYALEDDPSEPEAVRPLLHYNFIGERAWNGLRIKTLERVWLSAQWEIKEHTTYMAFIGDAAILASDLPTLRELLSNINGRQYLADNAEFQKAMENRGDIIYFSDVAAVMAEAVTTGKEPAFKANERGAVNIAGSSWENTHHLDFDESDWAKSLRQFEPKELSAPRDLLPASTIAYYLMSVDAAGLWSSHAKDLLPATNLEAISKVLALDLKQEVLHELGPECGGAMLELVDMETMSGGSLAVFCKLQSNKLAEALKAGKLLRGVGPVADFAEIKVEDTSYFVAIRNGFLVVANNAKTLAAFDGKTNLAATRDYSRAIEKVPGGIVAFGGYNLEAAVAAAARTMTVTGPKAEAASLIFSLAKAFHSQNFYATATAGTIDGRSSVAMDREGRYRVSDISYLPRGTNITFVTLEPAGIPITDQNRVSSLVLKVRAKSPGPIDNIKDEIKTPDQIVEQKAPNELLVTVAARRATVDKPVELPIKDPALEPYLKATAEFPADLKEVKEQAQKIAGEDRDAWSVARKLADWTHKNLEWKQVVTANAAQTLATREADCSEFSELFVTMARSLGLPARMVSGLAYSGNSFGGHAWVEVWVGKWIELDPTWGTAFVDATHIRNTSNGLLMSAALNLIELEVVETRRSVEDFQKSASALTDHLLKAIPRADRSDVEAAIDPATLTDEFMGQGAWSKMTSGERDQMSSAYRRFMNEILQGYGLPWYQLRLLYLEEKADEALATAMLGPADMMLKFRLVRRNELWYLADVLQADTDYYLASETLKPTIATIEKNRAGQKAPPAGLSDFMRVLLLINKSSEKSVAVVDKTLKDKPGDKGLLFLKAIALTLAENTKPEGLKLLRELSDQSYTPAMYRLATELSEIENEKKEELAAFERYTSAEPRDPRGYRGLARLYDDSKDPIKAQVAYRKAIELDPTYAFGYLNFISFLVLQDRIDDAKSMLAAAEKHEDPDDDLFGSTVQNLHLIVKNNKAAEKLAVSDPARLKSSYIANVTLARIYFDDGRYAEAFRLSEFSTQLDKEASDPFVLRAEVYRKQSRWTAAVKAAQQAIELDKEDSAGYYQLACALARLGRTKEALAALSNAIDRDFEIPEWITTEPDLKALRSLPAFKKLVAEQDK